MTQQLNTAERFRAIRSLVDDRDYWIAKYARDLIKYEPLQRFKLTARQRRVIGSLKVARELSRLQDPDDPRRREEEPPPVMGYDERGRIVVQKYEKGCPDNIRAWALNREGEPADIKGHVKSLKDDRIVRRGKVDW